MSIGRRLFIVDPSLKDHRGHHFTLAKAVTESAVKSGLAVVWLASKAAKAGLKRHPQLVPTFGHSMYSSYAAKQKTDAGRVSKRLERLKGRLIPSIPKPQRPLPDEFVEVDIKSSLLQSLLEAFDKFGIGPADRLLFHTADGATYEALAALVQSFSSADLPLIHICTPYDPIGVMPNRKSAEEVQEAIECFRNRELLARKVFLHAENALLADHLSTLWGCRVGALELPVNHVTECMKTQARNFRRHRLSVEDDQFLVTSLGAARLEKGFHLIPDIVRRTFEFAGTGEFADIPAKRIKFVLHASAQIIGRHEVIERALERFEPYSSDQVELLTESLSDVDYRNLTIASDAVLMPYDAKSYRVRGSGVVAEAIVAKKFIVAMAGSYPGHMANWQGGGVGESPALLAKALLTIIKSRWERFERVKRAAEEYLAANSLEQYVQKMLLTERRRDVRPSE